MNNNSNFHNDSTEEREHFVSISESIRHYIILKILINKFSKIIYYSNIRPADVPLDKNIRYDSLTIPHVVTSNRDLFNKNIKSTTLDTTENNKSFDSSTNTHILDTLDLVGRTFLIPVDKNGQCL